MKQHFYRKADEGESHYSSSHVLTCLAKMLQDKEAAEEMHLLVDIIRSVRNIRAEVNTPMSKKVQMQIKAKDEAVLAQLTETVLH